MADLPLRFGSMVFYGLAGIGMSARAYFLVGSGRYIEAVAFATVAVFMVVGIGHAMHCDASIKRSDISIAKSKAEIARLQRTVR